MACDEQRDGTNTPVEDQSGCSSVTPLSEFDRSMLVSQSSHVQVIVEKLRCFLWRSTDSYEQDRARDQH